MNRSTALTTRQKLCVGISLLLCLTLQSSCRQIIGIDPVSNGGANSGTPDEIVAEAGSFAVPDQDSYWSDYSGNLPTGALLQAGEVLFLSAEPNTGRVIAGLRQLGLFVTYNGGRTWIRLGSGAGSDVINHAPTSIMYDPVSTGVFWESGIYGAGIYTTSNSGLTLKQLGDVSHNDFVSVDLSDFGRQTLLAAGHEQPRLLYLSRDGGEHWSDIGENLPPNSSYASLPLVIDAQTFLLGESDYGSPDWGVLRSVDAGLSWLPVSLERVLGWPLSHEGLIYWLLRDGGGMIVSSDQGQNWSRCGAGPASTTAGGPLGLPNGMILTLGATHALVSVDNCQTWREVGPALPFPDDNCRSQKFAYSVELKRLFIAHSDCSDAGNVDSIWTAYLDAVQR